MSERFIKMVAVTLAGREAQHAERELQRCLDKAVEWADRADVWRSRVHRWADVVEQGARELSAMGVRRAS